MSSFNETSGKKKNIEIETKTANSFTVVSNKLLQIRYRSKGNVERISHLGRNNRMDETWPIIVVIFAGQTTAKVSRRPTDTHIHTHEHMHMDTYSCASTDT